MVSIRNILRSSRLMLLQCRDTRKKVGSIIFSSSSWILKENNRFCIMCIFVFLIRRTIYSEWTSNKEYNFHRIYMFTVLEENGKIYVLHSICAVCFYIIMSLRLVLFFLCSYCNVIVVWLNLRRVYNSSSLSSN